MRPPFLFQAFRRRWLCCLIAVVATSRGVRLLANPQGLTVQSGSASVQSVGSQLHVTVGQFAVLNWNSFDIQAGETTSFLQPSVSSIVFNNIGGANPSQILGNLTANGTVILANANGFYFGPNSMVKVGGSFVGTTAPLPPDLGAAASWQFTGMPPLAKIVNYGQIQAGAGHSLYLISQQIENHGTLTAPEGDIELADGQSVLVSERPDGHGLSAQVTLPAGSVDNTGSIVADAGSIALHAQVVNQSGILQADSVSGQNGNIELVASGTVNLAGSSQILAQGDNAAPGSSGGAITLRSGNAFSDAPGSRISVAGGAQGGNGGNVEISAPNVLSLNSTVDGAALTGWEGGTFGLDPLNITLGTSTAGGAINVNSAFEGLSSISLQASGNITLNAGLTWNLSASTGPSSGQLKLSAGGNIIFNSKAQIIDVNDWSVDLEAGVRSGSVQPGVGSIQIGTGDIQTAQGAIILNAGQDITVGTGFVNTFGGGSITANALAGSINAGVNNAGYTFGANSAGLENSGYGYFINSTVNGEPQVGGISTVAGGNVTLAAGAEVISIPTVPLHTAPGASGAYGQEAGNVTIIAGQEILGNYLMRNGTGVLEAGVEVQNGNVTIQNPTADIGAPATATTPVNSVSLSLMSGNWQVYAAQDIYLSEVRNPNGGFNANRIPVPAGAYSGNIDLSGTVTPAPLTQTFLSDYAPNAGASFWAGNSITLGVGVLPRNSVQGPDVPIFPPNLALSAGVGGINVENSLLLYPSSQGSLTINDLGNLNGTFIPNSTGGTGGTVTGIAMSDSGLPNWTTFAGGHAVTPLHLNDPYPVGVTVAGNINTFTLVVPTFAEITVGGSTLNFGFTGQNLSARQASSITVAGDITYHGAVSSQPISDALPAGLFDSSLSTDPGVTANLLYDTAAGNLLYGGVLTAADEAFLLNPTVYVVNPQGKPVLDATGNPETKPVTFSSPQVQSDYQAAIMALYTASQNASFTDTVGLNLNGPGTLNISAHTLDLGASGGIAVNDQPLPSLTTSDPYGANLDISLSGDLEMTTSKISNSGLLGSIQIGTRLRPAGGTIDLGLQSGVFGAASAARGIFTSGGGNVSVTTEGDINVDGSRIATLDGGNIYLTSLKGDINAGSGGNGSVTADTVVQLGPDGGLEAFGSAHNAVNTLYGSGIIAVSLAESTVPVGSISVDAVTGSINANAGGIEQVAYNHITPADAYINLSAGADINAGNSGVIGSNIRVLAGGNVSGIFIGSGGININAGNNFSGTVVGSTEVGVSAGGSISGTLIGGGNVSVSGQGITADIIGGSVAASGNTSGATEGFSAAGIPQQVTRQADNPSQGPSSGEGDDDNKKKLKHVALVQKRSRITVILPDATHAPH